MLFCQQNSIRIVINQPKKDPSGSFSQKQYTQGKTLKKINFLRIYQKLHGRVIEMWRTRICPQNLPMTARCQVIVMSSHFGSNFFFIINCNKWLLQCNLTMLESLLRSKMVKKLMLPSYCDVIKFRQHFFFIANYNIQLFQGKSIMLESIFGSKTV